MALVNSSVVVAASVERVFDFVAYPPNFSRMWPAMAEVGDLQPSPRGGLDWRWAYRMLGLRLEGTTTVLEYDRPHRIVMLSQGGGLGVHHIWQLADLGSQHTEVNLAMDFRLPAQWLTGFAERLLNRENRQQVAVALNNMRRALEKGEGDPDQR